MPYDLATKHSMLAALPNTVYLDLHTALPTSGNSLTTTPKAVTLPAAAAGARTATGTPICTWDLSGPGTATHIGMWSDAARTTRLGYFDCPDITLTATDKVDLNSFSCTAEDVAGK